MPRLIVPPPYRGPTQGQGEIAVSGSTVRACLEDAGRQHPGLLEQVLDAGGKMHKFVNVFVNGDEIERDDLDRAVAESDDVEILAAIAGG